MCERPIDADDHSMLLFSTDILGLTKSRLTGVNNIQKAVFVLFHFMHLSNSHSDRRHRLFVDKQVKSLIRMEGQTTTNDLHDISHSDVSWHQIFTVIQNGQISLRVKAFDNYWHLVRLLALDLLHHSDTIRDALALFKGRHISGAAGTV